MHNIKHYSQIANNDFIVFSDSSQQQNFSLWCWGLIVHDRDDKSLRQKNIRSHIKSDDYFGTLATVIDLIRQEKEKVETRQNKILKTLRDDLVYLQKNYKIIKKK